MLCCIGFVHIEGSSRKYDHGNSSNGLNLRDAVLCICRDISLTIKIKNMV